MQDFTRESNRKQIFEVWQRAGKGDVLEGEEKNQAESLMLHKEFYPLWNRLPSFGDADFTVHGVNPLLHITMHTIIENQLTISYVPEVEKALNIFLSAGYTRHEAVHQIMEVLADELGNSILKGVDFNNESYLKRISSLPFQEAGKYGRNEPCPCGSGKKYKHCCEEKGGVLTRQKEGSERKGRLLLGGWFYASPSYLMTCDEDDPILLLENKAAVIMALDEFGDKEGVAIAFQELLEDAENNGSKSLIRNTLQRFLEFCLDNKFFSEKGLEINKRLYEMEDSDEGKAGCMMDKAALYCNLSDYESAEKVYKDAINLYPNNGSALLAYARYLAEKGKNKEAEGFYQRVIALNNDYKDEADCAREELKDLELGK